MPSELAVFLNAIRLLGRWFSASKFQARQVITINFHPFHYARGRKYRAEVCHLWFAGFGNKGSVELLFILVAGFQRSIP